MKYLLIILLQIVMCNWSFSQIAPINRDTLKMQLEKYLAETKAPGVVVSLFTSQEILNQEIMGTRKTGAAHKITISDKFHLGSNSKAMTGFIAAALVERRLITWDTKFFDIFPELLEVARPSYHEITLQDLLNHRAFIREFTDDGEFDILPSFENEGSGAIENRLSWCRWLIQQEPIKEFKQGSYTYSNAGYAMATSMLERITSKDWEVLVQEELFQALKIEGGFGWPNTSDLNQPFGHYFEDSMDSISLHSLSDPFKIGRLIAPAGDIHMSMEDYVHYLQANMRGLRGENNILSAETYTYLHRADLEDRSGYAIGWGSTILEFGDDRYLYTTHSGSGGTFYCQTFMIPDLNIGFAIMSNAGDDLHEQGVTKIRNFVFKHIKKNLRKSMDSAE